MVRHAIDVAADDPVVIAEAELIILAAPVRQNVELLAALDDHVPGPALVTDVGSTKREIVARAQVLPPRFTFVGGHPLGGGAARRSRQRAPGPVRRPALAVHADQRCPRPRTGAPATVRGGARRPAARDVAGRARPPAGVSEPSSPAHRQRPDARGRDCRGCGGPKADRARARRYDSSGLEPGERLARHLRESNADELGIALDTLIAELGQLREQLDTGDALERVFDSAASWRAVLAERAGTRRAGS